MAWDKRPPPWGGWLIMLPPSDPDPPTHYWDGSTWRRLWGWIGGERWCAAPPPSKAFTADARGAKAELQRIKAELGRADLVSVWLGWRGR